MNKSILRMYILTNFAYKVFTTVVTQQSFYKASLQLNVTPSAVSHSINQLETTLGFPLFIRSRTGMRLTDDGQYILPYIQEIINADDKLLQIADNIKGLHAGNIRIGAFSSVCVNWLPHIIRSFSQKYPKIKIAIAQGSFSDISKKTNVGEIDIGFTTLPVNENLIVLPLISDPIRCVTPSSFVPKNRHSITKDDLIDQKFILQKMDYDRDTKLALDYYNVELNSINFSIDDQSIISMVEAGIGLGILPDLALNKLNGDINVYPFSETFTRQVALVVNKNQMTSPSVAAMVKHIEDFIKNSIVKSSL